METLRILVRTPVRTLVGTSTSCENSVPYQQKVGYEKTI